MKTIAESVANRLEAPVRVPSEFVAPDEVNSIDLAADAPRLEQAKAQFAPRTAIANSTLLAQSLSVIAARSPRWRSACS